LRREAGAILGQPPLEWSLKTLQQNIEESLRRLKTDYIDLMLLHSCSEELLKRGDVIRTLERALDAGKVRYIGYSGDGAAVLWAARSGSFQVIQTSVSVADQQAIDDIIPSAHSARLGIRDCPKIRICMFTTAECANWLINSWAHRTRLPEL
jgi:aryl-alcohol dehydrogenase-like predicted oxidoreductase